MNGRLKETKFRLALTGVLFLMMFLAVGLRAFQLQILRGEKLKRLGERQHLVEWIVLPKRGSVLDRSGEPLAISLESQSVFVRPRRLDDPALAASRLAGALELTPAKVRRKIKTDKPFVWLKRQTTPRQARSIRALRIKGVGMYYEPRRYYPQGTLAGQVIGFAGRDSQGLEGVERAYDAYIRADASSSVIERDARGHRVLAQGVEKIDVPPGADVHLTLDTPLQHLVEKQLQAAVIKYRAKRGMAIMVEPFTGEVMALANYPFFDPNSFSRQSPSSWRNRAVADSYEPGSTFKAVLAAAALEEGVVDREDLFFCEFGSYAFGGRVIHDNRQYGWLPFYRIIQLSSNIGATKVALRLKKERYHRYIRRFGFGRRTRIDLPGEAKGIVRKPAAWVPMDLAAHSFGQGIAVTPIQMVMAYAAIANGGFLMQPFVVRQVTGPDGKVLLKNRPHVVRRVVSEKTSRTLTSILKGVVGQGGTGVMARVEGFDVAGKTGTSQKADLTYGGYALKKRIASFIGFVPADDPRMVLLVLVDEPEVNVYGGVVAAPVFREVAQGALRYLGVAPKPGPVPWKVVPDQELVRVKSRVGARARKPVGGGGVPDFLGLSMREAVAKAGALKLRVEIRGHGYVVNQSPAPGATWRKGETVTLTLKG